MKIRIRDDKTGDEIHSGWTALAAALIDTAVRIGIIAAGVWLGLFISGVTP